MKTIKTLAIKKFAFLFGLFFTLFLFSHASYGQEIQVKGIVKGKSFDKIEALNGANIYLRGTKTGTSSNKKGEFTFPQKLKIGDILEVSYLGFLTMRIKVKENSSNLNIVLQEDDNQMLGALNSNKRYKSKRQKE